MTGPGGDRQARTDPPPVPAVVVLAAGAARRLGRPKALVEIGGAAVLARLVEAAGGGEPVRVVTGAHHAPIAAWAAEHDPDGRRLALLENRAWEAGRTGGLALAARALPDRDLLVAPCDVPLVDRSVFDALRAAWAEAGAPARGWLAPGTPRSTGGLRPGHPILIGRELARQLPELDPDAPLRTLRGRAAPLWMVEVSSPEIHDDLDDPDDLARLRARFLR